MLASEFRLHPRGPYLFDTWRWAHSISSAVGALLVELHTGMDASPFAEHGLAFTYKDGAFAAANDAPYRVENGVLVPGD